MLYTVYHLPQLKKVGCTNNFAKRMQQQDVEPLEEYRKFVGTIEEASFVEEELRKFYKYKPDTDMTYLQKMRSSSETKSKASPSPSVGWNELQIGATKKELLDDLNKYAKISLSTDGTTFEFLPNEYEALAKKAKTSQYKDFYWQVTNLKALKNASRDQSNNRPSTEEVGGVREVETPCAHSNTIPEFQQIRDWATDKGIFAKGDSKTQYIKLQEEAGEVAKALLNNDEPEIIDGLGDTLVVLINLAHLAGYRLEDCLQSAYDVISKRKGKMINGTFVKETL